MKNRYILLRMILIVLSFLAPLPGAQAFTTDPQDYSGNNTAAGQSALLNLTNGTFNTAIGWKSLTTVTGGSANTGIGAGTLVANTSSYNTATGAAALQLNTTGLANTANGALALFSNTTGIFNTAVGANALQDNTSSLNTAVGYSALTNNTSGGPGNVAVGATALLNNTTGHANTALGHAAGSNATTGDGNVYIGAGMDGVAGESNHTYIRNVHDTVSSNRGVYVNPDGRMGTLSSSRRYKEDIKPMDKTSEALFALRPVTFRYKKEIDRTQALSFGLIAEEAAGISPDLITRDRDGKPETVRYEAVNAMLLNEFLKEHKKVEQLEGTVASLAATVKEQAAQIQKVSEQIEMSKPAAKVVLNNP
jgi:trimeric autotransporter adhesin